MPIFPLALIPFAPCPVLLKFIYFGEKNVETYKIYDILLKSTPIWLRMIYTKRNHSRYFYGIRQNYFWTAFWGG